MRKKLDGPNETKIVFECTVHDMNGRSLKLSTAEYLILLQLQNRELAKLPAMTREEILAKVTFEERTLDGALAKLKKRGLIQRRIEFTLTDSGRVAV